MTATTTGSILYFDAPLNPSLDEEYLRQLAEAINRAMKGKTNNASQITLATSTTVTTVTLLGIVGPSSMVSFMPKTANAASELASGNMFVSNLTNNNFTITHASTTATDRTFGYTVTG